MTRLCTLFFLLLHLCACSLNPVTGKQELSLISETQEIALGEEQFSQLQQLLGGPYFADPKAQDYLKKVGEKLRRVSDRPDLPYDFVLVNNSGINAAALPGGKIVVYRGLLTKLENEAQLAAVLSHEIVHAAARHSSAHLNRKLLFNLAKGALEENLSSSPLLSGSFFCC